MSGAVEPGARHRVVLTTEDLLERIRRLIAAYDVMLADPETGAKGVDDTINQMRRLAGIEVCL